MKVLKFGGTSVGLPQRMHSVAKLITAEDAPKIVVLSALSGTTNSLVEIGEALFNNDKDKAKDLILKLKEHYDKFYKQLVVETEFVNKAKNVLDEHFGFMSSLLEVPFIEDHNKELLAQGELLSTKLFTIYLKEQDINAVLLPALDYMRIDEHKEPDIPFAEEKLKELFGQFSGTSLFITQGYICRNHLGAVDNLKRGGSDYTASLVGAAIRSEEVQIWTDIDGMHNNDPRIVDKTFPIADLSFDEAAELAYFGAKILHPATIWPAQKYNIPVRLLNTMQPEAKGTLISINAKERGVKAIAAKDIITAVKIKSSRMLLAYGFLRNVFEIFERYRTPIDMITTSEVAVSLTVDDNTYLKEIISELEELGIVEVDKDQTIICIVGNMISEETGIARKVFNSLGNIPIRMISFGGSRNNISILVDTKFKKEALTALNDGVFEFAR
jgi:aspartate kinase